MAGNYDHSRPLETACPPCVALGLGAWELAAYAGFISGAIATNNLQNQMTAHPDAGKPTNTGHPPADLSGIPTHTGGSILEQDKNSGVIADPIPDNVEGWNDEGFTINPDAGKPTIFHWTAGDKIKGQMGKRGWTDADIDAAIAAGPTGTSIDTRWTDTGEKLNEPATVYGTSGNYVVINNKTGDVAQVSNKKDPKWADDKNIKWNK